MNLILFYLLSFIALTIGAAGIFLTLIEKFSIKWVYYHYFIRKPLNWTLLLVQISWILVVYYQGRVFPIAYILPLILTCIALVLAYKMHQENAFQSVDFPNMTSDTSKLPIQDDMEVAVIEYEGITKCYPLDYVIHHHIINDRFDTKIVALTYCAMCRSIIPFDVTEIGPLFVASFKNANMIVADRLTKTFFQQSTFQSVIGKLHPSELKMIPFQILTWQEVKETIPNLEVVNVNPHDFRAFQLPIPGLWKRIIGSERTPGLSGKNRDKTFPARTRVVGITDKSIPEQVVYLKEEVLDKQVVINSAYNFFLIGRPKSNTVLAFKSTVNKSKINVKLTALEIQDKQSGTRWDIRGKYIAGNIKADLVPVAITDEYWFAWKRFHSKAKLIRL